MHLVLQSNMLSASMRHGGRGGGGGVEPGWSGKGQGGAVRQRCSAVAW